MENIKTDMVGSWTMTSCNECGKEVQSQLVGAGRICDECLNRQAVHDNACKHNDHEFVKCDEWERTCKWCGKFE